MSNTILTSLLEQVHFKRIINLHDKQIPGKHCILCLDTIDDGPLKIQQTIYGNYIVCVDCKELIEILGGPNQQR
jgi:hypothetical protein